MTSPDWATERAETIVDAIRWMSFEASVDIIAANLRLTKVEGEREGIEIVARVITPILTGATHGRSDGDQRTGEAAAPDRGVQATA